MLTFHLSSATLPKKIKSENMQHLVLKTNTQKPTESKAMSYKHQQTSTESFNSSTWKYYNTCVGLHLKSGAISEIHKLLGSK